jgi:C-terminal processing protease CtpA/Prc
MRYALWFCLLVIWLPCHAQLLNGDVPRDEHIRQQLHAVDSLWSGNKFGVGIAILEDLVRNECGQGVDDLSLKVLYQLGRGYALVGQTDSAIATLYRLASLGGLNYIDLENNSDLDPLRRDPRFLELVAKTRSRQMPWERLYRSPASFDRYEPNLSCALKTAGLSTLWSEAMYNFAYFDRTPALDWDSLYLASLPRVCATQSTYDYYQLLRRICALLHDGHTTINIPQELVDTMLSTPGIRTRLVGNRVLVTGVSDPALLDQGILPGDEIVTIDGLPVHDYAATQVIPYQSASTRQDLLVRAYEYYLLAGSCDRPVTIGLADSDGKVTARKLDRNWFLEEMNLTQSDAEYRILDGNIGYLALNTFFDEYLTDVIAPQISAIRGSDALIIDLRENRGGYPIIALNTLALFMEKPFLTHSWETPRYEPYRRANGGMLAWQTEPAKQWSGTGNAAYRKPIVILAGGRTYSAAEHFLVSFRNAGRGVIMGERSGGSTGHTLEVMLPGGGTFFICTTRDYFPDGSPFNGIGVEPDITVQPTVEDLRSGHDVVLQAAVKYLNRLLGRANIAESPDPYGRRIFLIKGDPATRLLEGSRNGFRENITAPPGKR